MIRREGENQTRSKNLLPNSPVSAAVGSQWQMLRDIKDSLGHLRREAVSVVVTSGSSVVSPSLGPLSTPPKLEPMQIKAEYNTMNAVQQHSAGGGGAVKSTSDDYRQKALAQIRNSLLPFANSDRPSNGRSELSSASSTGSDYSCPSQVTGSGSSSGVSSGSNGLDRHPNVQRLYLELLTAGYNEESAFRFLKSAIEPHSRTHMQDSGNETLETANGLTRSGFLNLKASRKSSLQHEGIVWDGQRGGYSSALDSSSASTRSDSPSVSIMGLQHHILLPDAPRLVSSGQPSAVDTLGHPQLSRQQSPSFPLNEPPPPPPPPRGVPGPPPTPPRGTTPPPPVCQSQYVGSGGAANNQVQQFFKRMSPVPPPSSRSQALSYASSVSSGSTPKRGTSPVSLNRTPLVAQNQQHLVQQLQTLSLYSGSGSSTRSEPPPPYPAGSAHSPAIYSPPSYASSSSGRQSPTPTISSSEYSVLSSFNLPLQKRTPPPAYTPPMSAGSPQPPSSLVGSSSATVVTSVLPRPAPLQAWSFRQSKSQSPVIMQSVKSTQVQKPVLQTAIAPTSPPVSSPPPQNVASLSCYPVQNQNNPSSSNIQGSSTGYPQSLCQSPNPPPYSTSSQGQNSPGVYSSSAGTQPTPPIYRNPSPIPPPYNPISQPQDSTAFVNPPPCYAVSVQTQNALRHETENHSVWQDANFVGIPTQSQATVPTTDPPSYASSIAALAALRAVQSPTPVSNNNNVPCYKNGAYSAAPVTNVTTVSQESCRTNGAAGPTTSAPTSSSNLVNTVESICNSQLSALPCRLQGDVYIPSQHTPLHRKPSPIAMDTASSASCSASRSESPVSFMSTTSTSSPSTQSDSTHDSVRVPPPPPYRTSQQSPLPPRKVLSKEKEEERRESKVRNYSPAAFKFFMEQHVENLLKSHQQREHRRQQLEREMAKAGLSEELQCQMRLMLHQKESNYIRLKRAKMDKSMFVKMKTIGVGAFGEVALVRKVDTNQLYAMKTLRKSEVLKRNQVAHVKAERDILAEANNEWVVKLYYSFQDKENLYFVMDYIPGGDLMSLLMKFGIFQENLAKFYTAEIILAVESVHRMGFIHRDIKPDNILIDSDGHIKLTDFGLCTGFRWTHNSKYYQRNGEHNRQDSMDPDDNWSNECHCNSLTNLKPLERRRRREHQRCQAHSLVGTPNYIAPEVLMRTGYTQLCDWWSVGVILYEMVVGQPPFLASNPGETQYKVINWEKCLHIPRAANLSVEATDLILKLCCGPDKRLGKNSADEIKAHQFFKDINFKSGLRKQGAPYMPRIRYPTDTSNFDPVDPDKLRSSGSSGDSKSEDGYENGKHPEHAFFEFTFRRFFDDGGQAYPVRINTDENENQGSPVYV
ncbi:serine/threonine-protein kinase warts isoform X1 [Tachypleus tridentatus]|uniref:serine/threonine-protein kinase warts isoform X1 n=2 Tax=Tachypleus tridentatus TaxID=6853 RepID=UPI003FD5F45A